MPWKLLMLAWALAIAGGAVWSLWYLMEPRIKQVGKEIKIGLVSLLLGDTALFGVFLWMSR